MGQGRYLIRRMMQLLFSISVVSFLISISSWLCYGFQTVRFCVTTLPVQLITHSINRNCIFLVCNGLLVFIAKTSGLGSGACASVSSQDSRSSFHAHAEDYKTIKHIDLEETREEEKERGILRKSKTCPTEESSAPVVDKEIVVVHTDDSSFKRWFFDKVNMEKSATGESEDEDIKELSMDEVNKRFDEFIWKMKEEIRLEASHQQLAMYAEI
ncbi:hypothetical protein QQ045_006840 [Rhodiola kirilowii]